MIRFKSDRFAVEHEEKWREIIDQIPFIPFPRGWKIQIIPPFGGAVGRFQVILPSGDKKSIYLDWYDNLGCFGSPYWEVYPFEGDVGRCAVGDVNELIRMIKKVEKK